MGLLPTSVCYPELLLGCRKLKAVAQMPRDVQLLILQHAAPLQSCQVRWLLTLPPVTAS